MTALSITVKVRACVRRTWGKPRRALCHPDPQRPSPARPQRPARLLHLPSPPDSGQPAPSPYSCAILQSLSNIFTGFTLLFEDLDSRVRNLRQGSFFKISLNHYWRFTNEMTVGHRDEGAARAPAAPGNGGARLSVLNPTFFPRYSPY